MKKPLNEFDDFLRSKEEEFHIPFKDEYWEQASALLEANRTGGFWTSFFRKPTRWGSGLAVLVLGGALLFYYGNKSQNTSPAIERNTTSENSIANIQNPQSVHEPNLQSSEESIPASKNSINLIEEIGDKPKASASGNSDTYRTIGSIKSTISSTENIHNKKNTNSIINSISDVKLNTTIVSYNLLPLSTLSTKYSKYFPASGIPAIPVFEEMTINDKTIPVYYGLPYQSKVPGSSSRKIREFSRGGLYPQLTLALSGGIHVFNTLKETKDTNGFISTNPYLGVKASYQINTDWIFSAQLLAIQRGGINQQIINQEDATQNQVYRQLYAVQVPLAAGYHLNKKNAVHLGIAPMINVASSYSSYDANTGDYTKSLQFTSTKGFSLADVQLSAGYSYRLNKKINFCANYYFGLVDITKPNTFSNDLVHRNYFASIGMNYKLLQKKVSLR